jgi:hypothetical protein
MTLFYLTEGRTQSTLVFGITRKRLFASTVFNIAPKFIESFNPTSPSIFRVISQPARPGHSLPVLVAGATVAGGDRGGCFAGEEPDFIIWPVT